MLRIAPDLRRVERREIPRTSHRVMRVLERGPCRVHEKAAEDDEDGEWSSPPGVSAKCLAEGSLWRKNWKRCRCHVGKGVSEPGSTQNFARQRYGVIPSEARDLHFATRGFLAELGMTCLDCDHDRICSCNAGRGRYWDQ